MTRISRELEVEHQLKWAISDSRSSNDFARAAAQAAILVNGGAATAMLALLSNAMRGSGALPTFILSLMPLALMLYACGVFLAALSLPVASKAIDFYMSQHAEGREGPLGLRGNQWWRITMSCIALSLICFLGATLWMAIKFMQLG